MDKIEYLGWTVEKNGAEIPFRCKQGNVALDGTNKLRAKTEYLDPVTGRWTPFHIDPVKAGAAADTVRNQIAQIIIDETTSRVQAAGS